MSPILPSLSSQRCDTHIGALQGDPSTAGKIERRDRLGGLIHESLPSRSRTRTEILKRRTRLGSSARGRIVTAAALLFSIAVGAFATSDVILVKELGLGIALALIDAMIVRALLVASLMAILGDANWWPAGRRG